MQAARNKERLTQMFAKAGAHQLQQRLRGVAAMQHCCYCCSCPCLYMQLPPPPRLTCCSCCTYPPCLLH